MSESRNDCLLEAGFELRYAVLDSDGHLPELDQFRPQSHLVELLVDRGKALLHPGHARLHALDGGLQRGVFAFQPIELLVHRVEAGKRFVAKNLQTGARSLALLEDLPDLRRHHLPVEARQDFQEVFSHETILPRSRYDIQFTPASLFHFVVIFFDFVQNSIEPRPVMSPTPNFDSFQPPKLNGSRGTGTPTFTPTIPALAFSMTYRATAPLSVKMLAALPYGEPFSTASASSTSFARMMTITGPKTSSWAMRMSGVTWSIR